MSVNTKVNGQLVKSAGLYSVTAPIGMADIYSTEEKEVGVWVDGKPLYQKTYNLGNIAQSSNAQVDISSLGIESVANIVGTGKDASGNIIPIPFAHTVNTTSNVFCRYNSNGRLGVYTGSQSISNDTVVTIQYTKTTDTPWSGKFVPQGYGYVSSGDIYSFEERQIGVYTDGKPLYQKTVDFGALPNNTTKQVAHNVANLDKIAYVNGIINYSGLIYGEYMPPVILSKSFRTAVRENVVEISTTDNLSSYGAIVTFQYTKTTDVAGSGEYVPSGDKAVHYSTDEEVIGTWIDGKTLYRKVLEIPISNKNTDYDVSSLNVDKMINLYGACGNFHLPLNTVHETSALPYAIGLNYGNDYIQIRFGASENIITPCYVVCEYTKTS